MSPIYEKVDKIDPCVSVPLAAPLVAPLAVPLEPTQWQKVDQCVGYQ